MGERGRVRELCDLGERTEVAFVERETARDPGPEALTRLGFLRSGRISCGAGWDVFSAFSLSEA